jgi:hypothetical protein
LHSNQFEPSRTAMCRDLFRATTVIRHGSTGLQQVRADRGFMSVVAVLAHTAAGFVEIDPTRGVVVWAPALTGIAAIARSAIAVIVML